MMNIESIRTLAGPNVYSHRPVLLMRLDLGELYEKESYEVSGFVERLLAVLPGLGDHHCSKGYAGGFVERLCEGTYFGHTVEHVTLELAGLAGCKATHGKTRYEGEGRAYGLGREAVGDSISRFRSDEENPGRANLYRVGPGYVMVDYGHNPEAFDAVCRMAAKWEDRRVTGIIGVPGDRDDSVVEAAGRVAARGFHRVIIKEDRDLRGRASGEVARLLCEAVNDEWPGTECSIALDEIEALRSEVQGIEAGQVVVIFYDQLEPVLGVLGEYGARPVGAIDDAKRRPEAAKA